MARFSRSLSFSEIQTAMSCMARWDMSYGGRLAGDALQSRRIAPILSDGRAWGAAVAAWHTHADRLTAGWEAHRALIGSLADDVEKMQLAGVPVDPMAVVEMGDRLNRMLEHYMATSVQLLNLTRLEEEIVVRIPSRSGRHASNRYSFGAKIDGFTEDMDGRWWIVEFKLRDQLHDVGLMQLARQYRWYAWALERSRGMTPVGIIIDERLNEAPRPPRMVKGRGKDAPPVPSHDKSQLVLADDYREVCAEHGEEPSLEALIAFEARRWQQRVPIMFRTGELDEAGQELVSAAQLINHLDSGTFFPIRNSSAQNCNGCRFKSICAEPADRLYVDSLFERKPAKRDREPLSVAA